MYMRFCEVEKPAFALNQNPPEAFHKIDLGKGTTFSRAARYAKNCGFKPLRQQRYFTHPRPSSPTRLLSAGCFARESLASQASPQVANSPRDRL
jgi:hypothetical protein